MTETIDPRIQTEFIKYALFMGYDMPGIILNGEIRAEVTDEAIPNQRSAAYHGIADVLQGKPNRVEAGETDTHHNLETHQRFYSWAYELAEAHLESIVGVK